MILLCTATRVEARACRNGISRAGARSRFEVLQTGMGPDLAKKGLQSRLAIRGSVRPSLIVSTGFSGSWTEHFPVGAWAFGKSVRSERGGRHELDDCSDHPFARAIQERCLHAEFLSLARPQSATDSSRENPSPLLVDMESFSWAEVSRTYGIPYVVVRMISDTPRHSIPGAVESIASAMIAQGPFERASLFAKGITQAVSQAVSQPAALAQFLCRSSDLPRLLSEGWREFSNGEFQHEGLAI